MDSLATILAELSSHMNQLEFYARKLPRIDPDSMDVLIGLPIESISWTLQDDAAIERVFCDERYTMALTVLLARIYVVLEFMYRPSHFMTSDSEEYARLVIQRIEHLLQEFGWDI